MQILQSSGKRKASASRVGWGSVLLKTYPETLNNIANFLRGEK